MPTRYHLHPETGEPGKCRATKSCPFGDIESEHYSTVREARAAFEERMQERVLAAHSRERTPQEARIQQLLEEKLRKLPMGDQRSLLSSALARYAEADTPIKRGFLVWSMQQSTEDFRKLGRSDLEEVSSWVGDAFSYGQHTAWYQKRIEGLKRSIKFSEENIESYKKHHEEGLAHSAGYGKWVEKAYKQDLKILQRKLACFQEELEELESGGGLAKAQAADEQFAKDLLRKSFVEGKRKLQNGDKVFDGINEFTFLTPDGEEHTVREELSSADYKYAGRMSIAQGEALHRVQEQGQVLVGLLSDEGGFHFPERVRADSQEERDKAFPPREGFRFMSRGGENNVYIHEPTQMLYKVPHTGSLMFPSGVDDEETRKKVLSRAVYLVEERYAEVEESLETARQKGATDVDYLKTYFLTASDKNGRTVPLVVQPKLDMEVHKPLDAWSVELEDASKPYAVQLADVLENAGFTDLHQGNIFYNVKTQRAVMFDCLFVPAYERREDYREQGLMEDDYEESPW